MSFQSIPEDDVEIEFILAAGSTFDEAFSRWGAALRQYHGKELFNVRDTARKYLGTYLPTVPVTSVATKSNLCTKQPIFIKLV